MRYLTRSRLIGILPWPGAPPCGGSRCTDPPGSEGIDPGHEPQRRFTRRCRLVVERGSRQAQQRTSAADVEPMVVVIDQLVQFTGIRAAETFICGGQLTIDTFQLPITPVLAFDHSTPFHLAC